MTESASIVEIPVKKGDHTFTIQTWSGAPDKLESPTFQMADCEWKLVVYRNGSAPAHAGFISVYLANHSNHQIRAKYTLAILDPTNIQHHKNVIQTVRQFEPLGPQVDGWGWDKFVSVATVRERFVKDDSIQIRVTVEVFGAPVVVQPWIPAAAAAPAFTLESLLEDIDSSDLDIETADGTVLRAHRCILQARSPVFNAMLTSDMIERTSGRVRIVDFETGAVRAMLRFIYTNQVDNSVDDIENVLAIALKYDLAGLAIQCENQLAGTFTSKNVHEIAELGERVGSVRLLELTAAFMRPAAQAQANEGERRSAVLLRELRELRKLSTPPAPSCIVS